ncbi:MAG: ABC transporter permease subunit [Desulfobacteraceae bacterium]|nr:ABC transporter permease subunit [Desulfobacteraceae bacterium]
MYVKEKISIIAFYGASILCAAITLLILGFMIVLSFPIFSEGLFFNMLTKPWSPDQGLFGLGPMIIGTICIALLSLIISFPVSLGCSFFVGILNPGGFGRHFKKIVELMTAIPTVIYGFAGIFLLVPLVRELFLKGSGMCILSAAIMLAILISPTMILFFVQSFKTVPQNYLNAVDALGGNTAQKFFYVILPNARKGMMTGIVLSFGRAVGDTLIALMISGNSVAFPGSVFDSARTLTAHIALLIAADFESIEFKTLFVCGICLYIITSTGVLMARYSAKKKKNHI